jgi:lysophospholipase L1-like esterase
LASGLGLTITGLTQAATVTSQSAMAPGLALVAAGQRGIPSVSGQGLVASGLGLTVTSSLGIPSTNDIPALDTGLTLAVTGQAQPAVVSGNTAFQIGGGLGAANILAVVGSAHLDGGAFLTASGGAPPSTSGQGFFNGGASVTSLGSINVPAIAGTIAVAGGFSLLAASSLGVPFLTDTLTLAPGASLTATGQSTVVQVPGTVTVDMGLGLNSPSAIGVPAVSSSVSCGLGGALLAAGSLQTVAVTQSLFIGAGLALAAPNSGPLVGSSVKDRFVAAPGTALLGHTTDSGHTWSASSGVPASSAIILAGNWLRNNNSSGASVIKSNWSPILADYEVYFDIYKQSAVGSCGVFARLTPGNLGYLFWYNSNTLFISKITSTGGTVNLAQQSFTIVVGSSARLRGTLNGTTLTLDTQDPVTGNWTTFLSTSDSTYTAPGQVGVYFFALETDTTGDWLGNFVAIDLSATDMIIQPPSVGGSGNVAMLCRGYRTAWTAGTPGSPTFGITHSSDLATLVSQTVAGPSLAHVTVNTGPSAGTFSLSDGVDTSTSVVAASTSTTINIRADVQSLTPHVNTWGLWKTGTTLGGSAALQAYIVPDYAAELGGEYDLEFVALANQASLFCQIANGATMRISVDGAAAFTVVGDGTNKTIVLYSLADGNQHCVRMIVPANSYVMDLILTGAVPALTSIAKAQCLFDSNVAGVQLPAVPSPILRHGAGWLDTTNHVVRQLTAIQPLIGYVGFIFDIGINSGTDIDALLITGYQNSMEPTIDGVVAATVVNMIVAGDAVLGNTLHWIPCMTGQASGSHTLKVVTIPSTPDIPLYALRAHNGTKTTGVIAGGATTFSVADASHILAGDWLMLDTGTVGEVVQVYSVNGNTLTLTNSLKPSVINVHAAGARVSNYRDPAASFFTPANPYTKTMVAVGDSITRGAQRVVQRAFSPYDPTNSYAYRAALSQGWNPVIMGITGETTGQFCKRLYGGTLTAGLRYNGDGDLSTGDLPLYLSAPADMLVIAGGTNDLNQSRSYADMVSNLQYLIAAGMDSRYFKSYTNGGRIFILTVYSPLAYNIDHAGSNNTIGLHVNSHYTADNSSVNNAIAKAIFNSGVNVGRPSYCTIIDTFTNIDLGTAAALGLDMHDQIHPNESGQAKIGTLLAAIASYTSGPAHLTGFQDFNNG